MFKYIIFISAIIIAVMAALFSVTGIATLFSAKFYAVVAMASALELGKLVMASYLYRWWKKTPILLKTYSVISVVVLMAITSIGIYGYLTAAYAEVAAVPQNTLNEISFIETRQQSLNETINNYRLDNTNIDSRQSQNNILLNSVTSGETDLSQRSAFANLRQENSDLDLERQNNNSRIELSISERDSLESVKVTMNADLNTNSDIGPFIYIARTLNIPLDVVVKWFVLLIVFVFDPLAISLILAYNNIVVKEQVGNQINNKIIEMDDPSPFYSPPPKYQPSHTGWINAADILQKQIQSGLEDNSDLVESTEPEEIVEIPEPEEIVDSTKSEEPNIYGENLSDNDSKTDPKPPPPPIILTTTNEFPSNP